jgi:hypothetical protein
LPALAAEVLNQPWADQEELHSVNDSLKKLSTRQKQAYAALCLAQFCATKRIRHPAVNQLIEHLLSVLISDNVCAWEAQGGQIEFSGQGSCLPSIKSMLPADVSESAFDSLVENVVEVGLTDMYGADTDEPLEYLLKCIETVKHHGIEPPSIEPPSLEVILSVQQQPQYGAWGGTIALVEYEAVLTEYRRIITFAPTGAAR